MKFILFLTYVFVLFGWVCTAYLLNNPHDIVLERLLAFLQIPDKKEQLAIQIFTPSRYQHIQIAFLIANILSTISLYFLPKIIQKAFSFYKKCYSLFQKAFQYSRQDSYFWILLALGSLPIAWRLCFYSYWLDEIFSYIFLVRKGVLVSLTYYPGPNNHVLFTAFSAIWGSIFLMRVWAFVSVLVTAWVLYVWISFAQNRQVGRWVVILFLLQSPVQLYGYLGRGYAWEMFFFALTWASFWAWEQKKENHYLVIATISSVAGFYTLPTFLYAYSALVLRLLFEKKNWKRLVLSQSVLALVVIILYLPIILLNGWQALAGNAWVQVGKTHFLQYFLQGIYGAEIISFWLFDIPIWVFWGIVVLITLGIICLPTRLQKWFWALFILPACVLAYQQVLPPARVWSYQAVTLAVLLAHLKVGRGLVAVFVGVLIYYWQFFPPLPAYLKIAETIAETRPKKVWANDDTYQMYLRYECVVRRQEIEVTTTCPAGKQDFDIFIITQTALTPPCFSTQEYHKIFENEEVRVYAKKSKN